MKKLLLVLVLVALLASGCTDTITGLFNKQTTSTSTDLTETSTIANVLQDKKLVIGTAPGYLPFEMKDTDGKFIGYDIDLGLAIGAALGVEVEFKQFAFSGLISALQTGEIDMIIAGMTIRGDRALAVSFSNPYYSTGQVLMVPSSDETTESWKDLDVPGKKIAVSQGTTGALLAKQIYKQATILDLEDFPAASMALVQGQADAVVYDEPAIKMYEAMQKGNVKGIYDLISSENLGIAVKHNDLETVQWLNSFLYSYSGGPADLASIDKWFHSTEWMDTVSN